MKDYSVEEIGEKAYLVEHTEDGDVIDMVMPLPSQGGRGGGDAPGPNTVGTEEIIDGSVLKKDLNKEVTDSLFTEEKRVKKDELDKFEV